MKRGNHFVLLILVIVMVISSSEYKVVAQDEYSHIKSEVLQISNVALGKPVSVRTNGANDTRESSGLYPSDITDGSLDYLPSSWAQEDGSVGYVNDDYDQPMAITVTIDLQGTYEISKIRYNMGHVERAETWNADSLTTPFGTAVTNPGSPYQGAWTEQTGNITLSSLTVVLEKTRVSYPTDWLFIGEIEVYGVPTGAYRPAFDLPFQYPGRGSATESEFVSAWQRCTTSFFDHKQPGEKGATGDGMLWFWTGDVVPGTNCTLFIDCYDGHEGYDFDDWACYGNTVYPAAIGEVIQAETGWKSDGYGNRVVIRHGTSGYKTLYGHLSNILVMSGAVDTNTSIGIMGETGCPGCGTHLHFNVYYNGKLVDPSGWEGNFSDPYVEERNGPRSFRQWLYPVQRRITVSQQAGINFFAPSGNLVAYIPPNVSNMDFNFTATELAPLLVPDQFISTGHAAMLVAKDLNGNPLNLFNSDITVEFRFNATDVQNIQANTLSIYRWDPISDAWIALPTSITLPASQMRSDSQSPGTATTITREMGYFALLGKTENIVHLPLVVK